MHRQAEHLTPHRGEVGAGALRSTPLFERPQDVQQSLSPKDRRLIRCVQPIEGGRLTHTQRMEEQNHLGQIRSLDFRGVASGSIEMPTFGPQPPARTRRGAPGSPRPLVGRGPTNFFDHQRLDSPFGIVTSHPRQTAIDHVTDPINGHRGFRHIG